MSSEVYLPYHRKHRPKTFAGYIGNEKIKKSGMAALRSEHKPQVMLFHGHAGCGKTTMARLMAKEYRCENRDEITGACGVCYSCKEMDEYIETGDEGNLMNLREIDVTEGNKKQDVDQLLEEAQMPAFDGGWKIFILDECHAMSNAAQNRLLKNLEEPAEKVLMILCTTDPDKLLETIRSRCQYTYKVTKPTRDELVGLLATVCRKEGVEYDIRALSLVCVKGDFVPRKTLVALEQVVREKQSVTYDNTVEVLNIVADKYFFNFYEILLAKPISVYKYLTFLGTLKSTMDLKHFVDSLLVFTVRGLQVSNGIVAEALDSSEIAQYKKVFSKFSEGEIAYLLKLLLELKGTQDIEARLMLLGYTGLKQKYFNQEQEEQELIDVTGFNTGQEKQEGTKNYLESITMSETEKEDFVNRHTKKVSSDDLTKLFDVVKVETME